MISEIQKTDWKLHKSLVTLQNPCSETKMMDARIRSNVGSTMRENSSSKSYTSSSYSNNEEMMMRRNREYNQRSLYSQAKGKKAVRGGYFGLESMLLLVCLTASLLILPLILPPLPPPPFLLLLVPIGILGLLMILAFMPSNIKNLTYM